MLIKAVYTAFLAIFIVLLLVRKQDGQPYRTYCSHVNDVFYFMFSPAIGRVKLQRNQLQFSFWLNMQNPWCLRYIGRQ